MNTSFLLRNKGFVGRQFLGTYAIHGVSVVVFVIVAAIVSTWTTNQAITIGIASVVSLPIMLWLLWRFLSKEDVRDVIRSFNNQSAIIRQDVNAELAYNRRLEQIAMLLEMPTDHYPLQQAQLEELLEQVSRLPPLRAIVPGEVVDIQANTVRYYRERAKRKPRPLTIARMDEVEAIYAELQAGKIKKDDAVRQMDGFQEIAQHERAVERESRAHISIAHLMQGPS